MLNQLNTRASITASPADVGRMHSLTMLISTTFAACNSAKVQRIMQNV